MAELAPEALLPLPPALRGLRRYALDGALLLFDRDTGLSALCDGPETAHLRRRAPRVVQFALTNECNLACSFCSRPAGAPSEWSAEEILALLRGLDAAGTLEVAFGGGEPLLFPDFVDLVRELHASTRLAVSATSNGTRLTPAVLEALAPCLAQLRLSVYDDVPSRPLLSRLRASRLRWGVNYLVTPARLEGLESAVFSLLAQGCRDLLLLAYKGHDASLHLTPAQSEGLARRVAVLHRALGARLALKTDVCWGERLDAAPRLLEEGPCAAGYDFVVLTSDRQLSPCSFHPLRLPGRTAQEVLDAWSARREALGAPSPEPGCARLADYGLPARRRLSVLR